MPHVFLSKHTSPSKILERFLEVSTMKTHFTHFAALWISGTWRDSYCPEWSNTSDRVSDASLTQGCSKQLERATPAVCSIWCLSPPEKTSQYIPPNGKQPENQPELKRASYHLLRWNCRSSQRWQPMVVGSEEHQKSTGRLSTRKIMGKSWELPTSKRVTSDTFVFPVVLWLVGLAAGHCIHYQQATWLGVSTWFSCFKVLGQKACFCFFDALQHPPKWQYRVIYGYRICLLQYTHVSFPPKTPQSWWSCGLTKRKALCLKRLYFVKTENVSAVRKGKRALYYDMDLHCCWLGKSLGSLC